MKRTRFALFFLLFFSAASCRCGSTTTTTATEDATTTTTTTIGPTSDAPTMPKGLLASPTEAGAPSIADVVERLSIARGKKGGEWAELQAASANDAPDKTDFTHWKPDSVFLSLEAMTLLHDAFARSLPGFDLFLPRLYSPAALLRLQKELTTLRSQLTPMQTAAAAKTRWGEVSTTIQSIPDDTAWLRARAALIATIDELVVMTTSLEKSGRGLWVLGI